MVTRNKPFQSLVVLARQIELRQATWARRAGMSTARLSQAVNGRIVLAPHHVERLEKALRAILLERETAIAKALGQEERGLA